MLDLQFGLKSVEWLGRLERMMVRLLDLQLGSADINDELYGQRHLPLSAFRPMLTGHQKEMR